MRVYIAEFNSIPDSPTLWGIWQSPPTLDKESFRGWKEVSWMLLYEHEFRILGFQEELPRGEKIITANLEIC